MKFERFYKDKVYLKLKNSIFTYLLRKNAIKKALGKIEGELVLDIGSGMSPIAPVRKKTVFADISYDGLRWLALHEEANAVVADITSLGLKTGKFDIVTCSEVLEHVADDSKALNEIYRVLKAGGRLVLTVPLHKRYWAMDDEFAGHIRRYEPGRLKEMLVESGFKITKARKVSGPLGRLSTFASAYAFSKYNPKKQKEATRLFQNMFQTANKLYYYVLKADGKIFPIATTSVLLIDCKK